MNRIVLLALLLASIATHTMDIRNDDGCQLDAPLPPAAARKVEAQRARLGASDPKGTIVL